MRIQRLLALAAGAVGLVALMLWAGGFFVTGKIPPGRLSAPPAPPAGAETARAEVMSVTDWYEAVGTVRARTETRVEAQVTGKVLKVSVRPGDRVKKGDTLITLDSRELKARQDQTEQALRSAAAAREQARETINAAEAGFAKADSQYRRVKNLYDQKLVSQSETEQAEAAYRQAEAALKQAREGLTAAEAEVRRAQKAVEEGSITTGHSVIQAYEDGEVAKRLVEPGDLAFPGKPLLYIQTGRSLQLEALVREGLIDKARPGTELEMSITALNATARGTVEEVVPAADPRTRTFVVKVGLPALPGLYPGMFGRLLVPMGQRQAVVVPRRAIRRVGQLETVLVREGDSWLSVFVKTGPVRGEAVEILSGLAGGETVSLSPGS